jgi:hypothetical protein
MRSQREDVAGVVPPRARHGSARRGADRFLSTELRDSVQSSCSAESRQGADPLSSHRQAGEPATGWPQPWVPPRASAGPGRAGLRVAPLLVLLLAPSAVRGQDTLGLIAPDAPEFGAPPETEMRARVAAQFPDAPLVRFRKVRPMPGETGHDIAFCGQVSATPPEQAAPSFHLFLYGRSAETETVQILGSESLNGYRVGRKLIGALRRIGCL